MKISLPFQFKLNNQNKIIDIACPSLDKNFYKPIYKKYSFVQVIKELSEVVSTELNIQYQGDVSLAEPFELENIKKQTKTDNEIWLDLKIDINQKKFFFENLLPKVGMTCNVISSVSFSINTLLALQIAAGNDDTGKLVSVGGAIINTLMAMIYYKYSDALSGLASIGRKLDDNFFRARRKAVADELVNNRVISMKVGLYFFFTLSTIVDALRIYNESQALGGKAIAEGTFVALSVIKTTSFMMSVSYLVSGLSFGGSFIDKLIKDVGKYSFFSKKQKNDTPLNQSNQDALLFAKKGN